MSSRSLWGVSFALVAGLHAGAGAAAIYWRPSQASMAEPAAAVMVELAPAPSAPQQPPSDIPPGPEQVEAPPEVIPDPEPDTEIPPDPRPEPDPVQDDEPDRPVIEDAEAVLAPVPERVPQVRPVQAEPAADRVAAPASALAPPGDVAAAPVEGAPSMTRTDAVQSWQSALLGRLERFKRYPSQARRQREEGVAHVRFVMNRGGDVVRREIAVSSGSARLDREALALLDRAQPLPPPPPDIGGETIELVAPVEFFLR
ncbi:MAG: energy transducer TonB [Oceanicaulis sp.]|nr:energy transducer TonB [Oceanicaulis sp.]